MAFGPEEITERLIQVKVQRELTKTKQLTIGTLLVLIAGNAGAIFGLQGCIQDAAVLAAEKAALDRVEKTGGRVEKSIERLTVNTETQAAAVTRLETRAAGFGERITGLDIRVNKFVSELTDHESHLNAASERVQKTNEELKKLQLVEELSDDQRGLLAELVTQVQSPEAQTVTKLLGSRVDAVRLPIGTILPWHKHVDTTTGKPVNPPPSGWVECNGPIEKGDDDYIEGSIIDLATLLDLNGEGRFLRGGTKSGTPQGYATKMPNIAFAVTGDGSHRHTIFRNGPNRSMHRDRVETAGQDPSTTGDTHTAESGHSHSISGGDDETRPVNMSVVWIIRVK